MLIMAQESYGKPVYKCLWGLELAGALRFNVSGLKRYNFMQSEWSFMEAHSEFKCKMGKMKGGLGKLCWSFWSERDDLKIHSTRLKLRDFHFWVFLNRSFGICNKFLNNNFFRKSVKSDDDWKNSFILTNIFQINQRFRSVTVNECCSRCLCNSIFGNEFRHY